MFMLPISIFILVDVVAFPANETSNFHLKHVALMVKIGIDQSFC